MKRLPFEQRAELCKNGCAKRLFQTIARKESNLGLVADVTTSEELVRFASTVGPHICLLKTHIDIVDDFCPAVTDTLMELAQKHDFLLFEDRKFADIGNTVRAQYSHGVYRISSWADIVNAHILPGPGIIEGLREEGLPLGRGLLLLAQMSSKGNLCSDGYARKCVAMAQEYPEFVIGYISQEHLDANPAMVHMTPGVNLATEGDTLGQQYNTPDKVIGERGSDVILVGRGIIKATDSCAEAIRYKEAAWQAYNSTLLCGEGSPH